MSFQGAAKTVAGNAAWYANFLLFGSVGLAIVVYWLAGYLSSATGYSGAYALELLALVPILAALILVGSAQQKLWAGLEDTPRRRGITLITLNDDGFHTEKAGFSGSVRWEHFNGVIETNDGLILLLSSLEFYTIPKTACPKGMDLQELKAQIETKIEQANMARPFH